MRFRISHTTKYTYSEPVSVCQNKAHLHPRDTTSQACLDYRLLVVPDPMSLDAKQDYFGNQIDYFALHSPHSRLSVTGTSLVEVDPPTVPETSPTWETIATQLRSPANPDELQACLFRFDSEFTQVAPPFADFARACFTPDRPIIEASKELTHIIYDQFKYDPRATTVSTPVAEVLANKAGVCQDFAHLQISCLRSLGLAARYVSGYLRTLPPPGKPKLVGADESHAWLSVYCGELGWIDFDPTNDVIPATDHITLAYGRDYADVCPLQGVFVGGGDHTLSVSVTVEEHKENDSASG